MPPEAPNDGTPALPHLVDEIPMDQDLLPDDLLDRHMDGGEPEPASRSKSTARRSERGRGTDDDEEGDDELDDDFRDEDDDEGPSRRRRDRDDDDDEDLDDEEDEDEEDDEERDSRKRDQKEDDDRDEEEDPLTNSLSPEDRKLIEKTPALKKVHKSLLKHFSRGMEEVSSREEEVATREEDMDYFLEELRSAEGAEAFLKDFVLAAPEAIGKALEALATDDGKGAETFLVEVALHNPEVFKKAMEQVELLNSDEREMKLWRRERDADTDKARTRWKEQHHQKRESSRETARLKKAADEFAGRAGIQKEDMPEVYAEIGRMMRARKQKGESTKLSRNEIGQAVQAVKRRVSDLEKRIRSRVEKEQGRGRRRDRERPAPRGRRSEREPHPTGDRRTRKSMRRKPLPAGRDPLDSAIDAGFDRHGD